MWDFLSLNGMTVAQLRVIARGMGIPGADDMAKAQLVYGIMDAQEGGTASEDQQPAAPEAAAEEEGNTVATCDWDTLVYACLLYTSPSPRDRTRSRRPSSA